MLHRYEGIPAGVDQDAAVPDAEDLALHPEHDVPVDVGDGEVAVGDADGLLGHGQIHRVRGAELRAHHGNRARAGRRRRIARHGHGTLQGFLMEVFAVN